jgi:acyl-CoA dehydrogenase
VLKRWQDEGQQDADLPLVAWCIDSGLVTIATRFDEILANFPNRLVAGLLRLIIQPLGPRRRGPSDNLTRACATFLLEPSATRERLTVDLFHPKDAGGLARLENAFKLVAVTQPLRDRLNKAHVRDIDQALRQNLINGNEATQLKETAQAVAIAIAVDDFTAEELTHHDADHAQGDRPSPALKRPRPAAAE